MTTKTMNVESVHAAPEIVPGEAHNEAPDDATAKQGAERMHDAAKKAASVAQAREAALGEERMTAVDQLEQQLSATTDAAAAEGKEDVQAAKARGESYLEQAKGLASSVLSTAQSYLPASVGGSANAPDIGPHTKPKSVEERVRHHEVEEPNKAEDAVEKLA